MTDEKYESLAKRYAGYLGFSLVKIRRRIFQGFETIACSGLATREFSSFKCFLLGSDRKKTVFSYDVADMSFNDLVRRMSWIDDDLSAFDGKLIEYSSAEELDFKLSAMGF